MPLFLSWCLYYLAQPVQLGCTADFERFWPILAPKFNRISYFLVLGFPVFAQPTALQPRDPSFVSKKEDRRCWDRLAPWPWPVFRLKRTKFLSYFALKRPKFRSWFRYMEENSQISLIPKRNFSKFQKFLAPPSGVCKEEGTKEKQEMWFLE